MDGLAEDHARALLLDFSADLLGVTGFDGRVRWANPAHEVVLGIPPRGARRAQVQRASAPRRRAGGHAGAGAGGDGRTVASFEARLRTADGSYRWFQFSIRAHPGLEQVYSVGRDVTERRRVEDELALAHELALAIAGAESAELAIADVLRSVCERTGLGARPGLGAHAGRPRARVQPGMARGRRRASTSFRRVTEALSFLPGIGLPGKAWELAPPGLGPRRAGRTPASSAGCSRRTPASRRASRCRCSRSDEVVAVMEFFLWEEREEDERLVALVSAVAAQLGTLFRQKQAEQALRASEEHFRAVADTAADAIVSRRPARQRSPTRTRPRRGSSASRSRS